VAAIPHLPKTALTQIPGGLTIAEITKLMSSYNQFYAGAEPSYFPVPGQEPRPRKLGRGIVRSLILTVVVAIPISVALLYVSWQTPPDNLAPPVIPASKQVRPQQVHPAPAVQEPPASYGGNREYKGTRESVRRVTSTSAPFALAQPIPQLRNVMLEDPPLLPPFPTEQNLRIGMPRSHLVRAFGKPDLSARTLQQERLMEIYVYEQQDRATFVVLQDGRVASAYTGSPQRVRILATEPDPDF